MLVPQFAQLKAPTAVLFPFFPPTGVPAPPPLPVAVATAGPAEGLLSASTPGDDILTATAPAGGDWGAADGDGAPSSLPAPVEATASTSILPTVLLPVNLVDGDDVDDVLDLEGLLGPSGLCDETD